MRYCQIAFKLLALYEQLLRINGAIKYYQNGTGDSIETKYGVDREGDVNGSSVETAVSEGSVHFADLHMRLNIRETFQQITILCIAHECLASLNYGNLCLNVV